MGGGLVLAIPFTSIVTWAELHELDREATRLLAEVIRVMDVARAAAIPPPVQQPQKKRR